MTETLPARLLALVKALTTEVEMLRKEAREEARQLYELRTDQWDSIRTIEGRTKEQCASRLEALLRDAAPQEPERCLCGHWKGAHAGDDGCASQFCECAVYRPGVAAQTAGERK